MLNRLVGIGAIVGSGILGIALTEGMLSKPSPPTLAQQLTTRPAVEPLDPALPSRSQDDRVDSGKIRWHPTFDAARAASQTSHKPVLVFHMMGRLDQQFC